MVTQTIILSNPLPTPFFGTVATTGRGQTFGTDMLANQIAGLVPVGRHTDCRPVSCFCLPVFSTDRSSFLFESLGPVGFRLEKWDPENAPTVDLSRERAFRAIDPFCIQQDQVYPPYGGEPARDQGWVDLGPVDSLGAQFPFGGFASQPYWSGFQLEWQQVFTAHGPGRYRIAAGPYGGSMTTYSMCLELSAFTCEGADGTVYVQARLNSTVGDIMDQRREFLMKNINWEDSCRYPGRLSPQTPEYEDTTYFAGAGRLVSEERLHRSRATVRYLLKLYGLPLELVLRLFAYGTAKAFVTDYNHVTPSHTYKAVGVARTGGPEISDAFETLTGKAVSASIPLRHLYDNNLFSA